jgi:hypothetical protein
MGVCGNKPQISSDIFDEDDDLGYLEGSLAAVSHSGTHGRRTYGRKVQTAHETKRAKILDDPAYD